MKFFFQIAILVSSLWVTVSMAQPTKLLIVNTDAAVPYYKKIASEFESSLPNLNYQWSEFDLKAHGSNDKADLQKLLQKETPDIIYCIGSQAYLLSQQYSGDKILIFAGAINWEKLNINDKTYGVSNELAPEQEITLLRVFLPQVKKIGVLYSERFNQEYIDSIKKVAQTFKIEIFDKQINETAEVNQALNELLPDVDLLWVIADPQVLETEAGMMNILHIAKQQQKPVYAYKDIYVKQGAALSISPDPGTIARQSANLVFTLTEGNFPVNKVQFPAGSSVSVNKCVFEALKIPLNKETFSAIDQIVSCPLP